METTDTKCKNCGSHPCLHGKNVLEEHLATIEVGCRLRNEVGGVERDTDNDGITLWHENCVITKKEGEELSYKYDWQKGHIWYDNNSYYGCHTSGFVNKFSFVCNKNKV